MCVFMGYVTHHHDYMANVGVVAVAVVEVVAFVCVALAHIFGRLSALSYGHAPRSPAVEADMCARRVCTCWANIHTHARTRVALTCMILYIEMRDCGRCVHAYVNIQTRNP